jgi:predicted RNase H-like HicB family nuclease
MKIRVEFYANMPVKVTKKDRWFVACCPILDVYSQGESEEKAKKNLGETLTSFFLSCFERGTLDDVLKKCGFKPQISSPPYPLKKPPRNFITVPIPFMVNARGAVECHA